MMEVNSGTRALTVWGLELGVVVGSGSARSKAVIVKVFEEESRVVGLKVPPSNLL